MIYILSGTRSVENWAIPASVLWALRGQSLHVFAISNPDPCHAVFLLSSGPSSDSLCLQWIRVGLGLGLGSSSRWSNCLELFVQRSLTRSQATKKHDSSLNKDLWPHPTDGGVGFAQKYTSCGSSSLNICMYAVGAL